MTPADGPPFVARTSAQAVSPAQVFVVLLALASVLAVLTGVGGLLLGDDTFGSTMFVVLGTVFVVAALVGLRRLRAAERYEIRVDPAGITTTSGRRPPRSWRWDELVDVAVVHGVTRILAIEDGRTAAVREAMPRLDSLHRVTTGGSTQAARVPLTGMQPDEHAVLTAIATFSGGRFPSPERGPRLPGR